ncbi:MAG: hypothetical protein ACRD4S_01250 [Candidatus Acidiferrales bacterium]
MNRTSRLKLRREVSHGGIVPRGWQMAWYEPRRRVGVYYPAPLHWIVRVLREFAYRLRAALQTPSIERTEVFQMQRTYRERQRLAEEYARGYMAGWRECFDVCLDAVEQEMANGTEAWDVASSLLPPASEPSDRN